MGLLSRKWSDGARLLFGKCAPHPVATSGPRPLNMANVNYMCAPGVLQATLSLNCGRGPFKRNEMFICVYDFCFACVMFSVEGELVCSYKTRARVKEFCKLMFQITLQ